jgi:hypothetical protein
MQAHDQAIGRPAQIAKLRPNPFSQVTVRREAGRPVELRVWCVTRSRGAVTRNFATGKSVDFERIYEAAAGARSEPALSDLVVLTALGLWAPEADLIAPVHIHAPLRPQPDGRLRPPPLDAFALRGEVWLQEGAEPPPQLSAIPLTCLSPARPILWHQGSAAEPPLPWWPDADCLTAVSALQGRAPRRPDMLPALLALAAQGIARGRSLDGNRKGRAEPNLESHRKAFSQHGFTVIEGMLPSAQVSALRSYWQKLAALDVIPDRGDNGTRRGSHGEPSSALLLHLLQSFVERIVGADIKPAYSYAWVYRRGAALPSHRDRDACRCTVSLLVDFAPAVDGPTPWPLGIHPRGGGAPIEIEQSVGDAVIFNGQELKHFRPEFTSGERSTSLLMHYVDRDFSGVLF